MPNPPPPPVTMPMGPMPILTPVTVSIVPPPPQANMPTQPNRFSGNNNFWTNSMNNPMNQNNQNNRNNLAVNPFTRPSNEPSFEGGPRPVSFSFNTAPPVNQNQNPPPHFSIFNTNPNNNLPNNTPTFEFGTVPSFRPTPMPSPEELLAKFNKEFDDKYKIKPEVTIDNFSPDVFTDEFKDQVNDLLCPCCKKFPNPENALEVQCCGCLFCRDCLKKILGENHPCPACNAKLIWKETKIKSFKEENLICYRTVSDFKIKCLKECEWTGTIKDYETHLLNCDKRNGDCCYKDIGCKFHTEKADLKSHEEDEIKEHLKMAEEFLGLNPNDIIGKAKNHPHVLKLENGKGWICSGQAFGCSKTSGSTNPFDVQREEARFYCSKCNFSLCPECFYYFLDHNQQNSFSS
ncbi:MAG: hypothetical protein MJ252_27650 [archaeon]|nr:hypothetical protein [archaeon]